MWKGQSPNLLNGAMGNGIAALESERLCWASWDHQMDEDTVERHRVQLPGLWITPLFRMDR